MSEENFTESVELPLTEQDKADLKTMHAEDALTVLREGEEPSFHTVLEVWREVLKPAFAERNNRVTPQWATRICASYKEINYADFAAFKDLYYDRIEELINILVAEIDSDEECLNQETPIEDVAHNAQHYKNIIRDWQVRFLEWELAWSPDHSDAAIQLATISEIHRMILGPEGLLPFLESIQFQFSEEDQTWLRDELEAVREAAQ